jgi:hypothetical protein
MSVLDIQRQGQPLGRLRMGEQVGTGNFGKDGKEKMRPVRRETWRLTTGARHSADSAAAFFDSEVRPWNGQWEVDTRVSEISVMVPPRDEVISQNYEMWTAGGAARRCDSQFDQVSAGPCLCPHAADPGDAEEVARMALRRADMARANPPRACHLITRVSFMIPDLPGLGVWRLDTSSYYAAVEIGDAAMLMQAARDQGVSLAAILRIDQRQRVAGGQTKRYPVPVLEILATFRQIASGELEAGGVAAQLPPAPGEQRRAIAAGTAAPPVPPAAPVARGAVPGEIVDAEIVDEEPGLGLSGQYFADLAPMAKDRLDIEAIAADAKEAGVSGQMIRADDEATEQLREYLARKWRDFPPTPVEQNREAS